MMPYELRVDPGLHERYPGYTAAIVYARELENGPSDERSSRLLRDAEATARAALGEMRPQAHPHIAAWREAFGSFGAKPSHYPCSVEALLSRVLKGQELPPINWVVDAYNAVSIRHVLPVGGEDRDALTSDLLLRFADGDEPFDVMHAGTGVVERPDPGEVVWVDSSGVTCRRWNWRQGHRTRLTETTRNAYFILDRLAPLSLADLRAAVDDLVSLLRQRSPGCAIDVATIGPLHEE
jgi:DNA/RNA-binding domain of Phe-tRNA-synthetase-like protein